jgi:predicted small lipoprotein YifL
MQKLSSWARLTIVLCLLLSAMACGQKGDLYLPEGNALISWLG